MRTPIWLQPWKRLKMRDRPNHESMIVNDRAIALSDGSGAVVVYVSGGWQKDKTLDKAIIALPQLIELAKSVLEVRKDPTFEIGHRLRATESDCLNGAILRADELLTKIGLAS